ncbi:auxin-responsive protein IAA10-like isoform X1 [Canna indica]|uniref:Auxin-responsive protein n=1 Tax=Canna indica TaxID=4628 RepID=A0AAQ3QHW8_9LILI|nr:auxin-responsive protein IAA10-like isoform X1 [Canna indica]
MSTAEAEEAAALASRGYVGMSEVCSSSYPGTTGVKFGLAEEVEEEELELGLSLGTNKPAGGGAGKGEVPWGEYCRILTADDLPSMGPRASPLSSSSSVSSSSSPIADGVQGGVHETKKTANNPPSQTVVGWPPIRAHRMNNLVSQCKDNTSSQAALIGHKKALFQNIKKNERKESICCKETEMKGRLVGNSCFVKVNMDGDPIGRKVDLSSHPSYETLALALEAMFFDPTLTLGVSDDPRTSKLLDGSSGFALTYEDKDGDWMLVGDVPWRLFLNTVKRLRIMRTADARGLGKLNVR